MCGIAGVLYASATRDDDALRAAGEAMAGAIAHRGPDDHGTWRDAAAGIVLAHRRLSIIDLSPQGHQPMTSATGRFVVAFNGEIYNFEALRAELKAPAPGAAWRGHSDTEVMLAAFDRWGIAATLPRLNGMFAIAVWDRAERVLHLARDPLGEKPLYVARLADGIAFASDLGALRRADGWNGAIDREALADYARFGYVAGARSIHAGTTRLLPGHAVAVRAADARRGLPDAHPFWDVRQRVAAAVAQPFRGTPADAVDALDALLRDAVQIRTQADVPFGAFLSGGVDSSTIVALMQAQSARPVRTFTIGFEAGDYDEAARAAAVARHLGTDHTEVRLSPDESLALVPTLAQAFTEPFADSSQLPTMLVSRVAREHVTMALSGDGGDELFAGYSRYPLAERLWRRIAWMPAPARRALRNGVRAVPDGMLRLAGAPLRGRAHEYGRGANMPDKLRKLADIAAARDQRELYERLTTQPVDGLLAGAPGPAADAAGAMWRALPSFGRRMQYLDLVRYLPDDILVKVDRSAMWVSLETRVPMLDVRVVELAWSLPESHLRADGAGKWPLRQLLARHVPPAVTAGPKRGFAVPLADWLRGPLRDWMLDLLAPDRLRREAIFHAPTVERLAREHLSGTRNWQQPLWIALVFQSWMDGRQSAMATPEPAGAAAC